MVYGTLSTLDTLASVRQSVVEFGEDRVWEGINVGLEAQNRFIRDMTADGLMERTTDALRAYGAGDTKVMEELDQFGAPSAQKITAGLTLGFPLRRYGNALQWTRQFFETYEVAQLAAEVTSILQADRANIIRAAKTALFTSTNASFLDKLGKPANVTLPVKALVNNDGAALPVGPNGETFPTSHTHYLGSATLTASAVSNLVVTVQEHYNSGGPILVISQTDETAFRALVGFVADVQANIVQPNTATYTTSTLNTANLYDRRIGLFGAAEVWIKPWAIANYIICYMTGAGTSALAMRVPTFEPGGDLRLMADDELHPLRARTYERQFGIGVNDRVAAAILQFNNATFTIPTIA